MWPRQYLPQLNQRLICKAQKLSEFVWVLVDSFIQSVIRQTFQVFTGEDGVVRTARDKMTHREENRPFVKVAPVFHVGVSKTKIGQTSLAPLQNNSENHQAAEYNF